MAYTVKRTFPGAAAKPHGDARICIEIQPAELKWPIRFHFLMTDEDRWANVGFEIGVGPIPRSRIEDDTLTTDEAELTPSALRWVQENLFRYRELAESELNTMRHIRGSRKKTITPEFLAHVAAQYRDLGGERGSVYHLAAVHGVSRTTIWRWLKRAGIEAA